MYFQCLWRYGWDPFKVDAIADHYPEFLEKLEIRRQADATHQDYMKRKAEQGQDNGQAPQELTDGK